MKRVYAIVALATLSALSPSVFDLKTAYEARDNARMVTFGVWVFAIAAVALVGLRGTV